MSFLYARFIVLLSVALLLFLNCFVAGLNLPSSNVSPVANQNDDSVAKRQNKDNGGNGDGSNGGSGSGDQYEYDRAVDQESADQFKDQRNPQCTQSSKSWDKEFLTDMLTEGAMSNMFADKTLLADIFPSRTEPITYSGALSTTNPNNCCGACSVQWPEVTLHYWPESAANTECLKDIATDGHDLGSQLGLFEDRDTRVAADASNPTVLPGLPPILSRRTVHAPIVTPGPKMRRDENGNPSRVTRSDGRIFVSPSIYLEIPIARANDDCGPVGKKYEGVFWSYPPEDVRSVMPEDPTCWPALLGLDEKNYENCKSSFKTESFNFADLPCPPDSLRARGSSTFIYDTRVEYEPVLEQPVRLSFIDTAWSTCSANVGWDPPTYLQEFGGLAPTCNRRKGSKLCKKDEDEVTEPSPALAEPTAASVAEGVAARAEAGVVQAAAPRRTAVFRA